MTHDWLDDFQRLANWATTAFVALVKRLRLPGRLSIHKKEETDMGFNYTFNMPAPNTAVDWAKREIIATVNGVEQPPVAVEPKDAALSPAILFADNDNVSIAVADTDDANNRTVGEAITFLVVDDVAPGAPGVLSINSKDEV